LPVPAVVVLHEVFGVNADIRKACDELAQQGFIAVAPDIFWRQEPGVDLGVTSEPDWQHGFRLFHWPLPQRAVQRRRFGSSTYPDRRA
jgi:carboxymethylenebutenolidase